MSVDWRGAIAQLGERLPCTQEVGGSIPPGSTTAGAGSAVIHKVAGGDRWALRAVFISGLRPEIRSFTIRKVVSKAPRQA